MRNSGSGPSNQFKKSFKWFWWTLTFEKLLSTPSGLKGLFLLDSTRPFAGSSALSQPQWKAKPEVFSSTCYFHLHFMIQNKSKSHTWLQVQSSKTPRRWRKRICTETPNDNRSCFQLFVFFPWWKWSFWLSQMLIFWSCLKGVRRLSTSTHVETWMKYSAALKGALYPIVIKKLNYWVKIFSSLSLSFIII